MGIFVGLATQGQRLPQVLGFDPRPWDPQPDAMTIISLLSKLVHYPYQFKRLIVFPIWLDDSWHF